MLKAHRTNASCASCHNAIDRFGYAFGNFDPVGARREKDSAQLADGKKKKRRNSANAAAISVDACGAFLNGSKYEDIRSFRKLMRSPANRDCFVRCFVIKLLIHANGEEPKDNTEINKIMEQSTRRGYRIVDTIAAVIHSPLFRKR